MELRELKTFLMLCEELHFSRTALRLHVVQSAVSYAIKNLEEELGTPLFVRTKRSVSLTPAGERFRERVAPALQALQVASDAARRVGKGDAGKLSVRFTLMGALTVAPRAIARFKTAYPDVDVELGTGGSIHQLEELRAGRGEIGVMPYQRKSLKPLASEIIARSPLVALLPSAHAFGKRKSLALSELARERFIALKLASEPETRRFFRSECLRAGFEPDVVLEAEQLEVLLAMVSAGLGIACMPDLVAKLRFPGVTAVPIAPTVEAVFAAVWDPRGASPAARNFMALLRDESAKRS